MNALLISILHVYLSAHDEAVISHVSHPEHQAEFSVSLAYHSVLAEHNRSRPEKEKSIDASGLQTRAFHHPFHLALGRVSLAKTRPTMKAWIRQPDMDCSDMTIIADVHLLVVCL